MLFEPRSRFLLVDLLVLAILALGLGHPSNKGGSREPTSPRPSCFAGTAWLGSKSGAIDFRARCRPTAPSGSIEVTVSQVTPDESQFVPLKAFQRFPNLKAAGAERRARCVRTRGPSGQIICSAKIKGSAVLEGRIWLEARDHCETKIQLTSSPSYEPCKGVCASVLPAPTLIAGGPPRGC